MTGPEAAVLVVVFAWGALAGGLWRRDRTAHWRNIAEWNGEETEAIKGADLDEDVAQYRRRRTSGEHPAVEDPAPPSWMDQSGYRPPAASLAAQRQVVFEDDDDPSELGPLATGGVVPSSSAVTFSESDGCVVPDRPPMANGLHVSRGWDADRFAPDCGCEIAHCGLVIPQTGCLQHDNFKTFRQAHRVEDCPAYADDPAEQPFVHTPCGTPISVLDDGAEWCPTCGTFIDREVCAYGIRRDEDCGDPSEGHVLVGGAPWFLCARHYVDVIERGATDIDPCETCKGTGNVCDVHGRGICLDCDEHDRSLTGCPTCTPVRERCGDISPVTGASCQHPPGHTIRHVGPLGEGTYRERWDITPDPLACVYDRTDGEKVERIADWAARCACPDCWAWLRTNGYLPDSDASDGPRSLPTPRVSD